MGVPLPSDVQPRDVMRLHEALSRAPDGDADLQRIAALAANACHAPVAILAAWEGDARIRIKASHGIDLTGEWLAAPETDGRVLAERAPVMVVDLREVQRPDAAPLSLGMRFYLGAPLCVPGGSPFGVLAVLDTIPHLDSPAFLVGMISGMSEVVLTDLRLKASAYNHAVAERIRTTREYQLRHLAEERTAILDALPARVALLDADGVVAFVNGPWRDATGPDKFLGSGATVGDSYLDIGENALCTSATGKVVDAVQNVLSGSNCEEFRYQVPDTGEWVGFMAAPALKRGGTGAVVMHLDLTQAMLAEREAMKAKETLQAANRAKSEFLANVSHELRTPLNAIIGFSEMIKNELFGALGNEKYRDYAADIYQSGMHLLSLIDDILDLSKIDAGAFEPNLEPVDLADVFMSAARILRQQARGRGIAIALAGGPSGAVARVDRRGLKQVALNLLSNAIKFSPQGGHVSIAVLPEPNGAVIVKVSDQGEGMDEDQIAMAFQPFRRVGAKTNAPEGTGLGLSISRRIVEAHGGRLELQSRKGHGTVARMVLPEGTLVAPLDGLAD